MTISSAGDTKPASQQPAADPAGPQAPAAASTPPATENMPWGVPVVIISWLAILLASVPLYHDVSAINTNIPLQAGPVPLGVIWWGALGGVTVSLVGICWHWRSWDPKFTLWHVLRPVIGGIVGAVSYLIFITVIRSTGTTPAQTGVDSRVVYFLVAFITGYQEQTFRDLIGRAAQVLLGPGQVKGQGGKSTEGTRGPNKGAPSSSA